MYQIDFSNPVHVFFSGIGGISMSGLAKILMSRGFKVSGSDRTASALTEMLQGEGARVIIGQKAENITPDIDLVVFTAAIHPDNPEYIRTAELGIPSLTRAQLLGQIMKGYHLPVAVSGTHGKTTTTSMLSEILIGADTDPTLSIGGVLPSIGGNVRVGGSDYFVAEACEYTNSFLDMFPGIGIILNIDADHLDFFKDLADIRHSFKRFAGLIPEDGCLIISDAIPDPEEITDSLSCRVIRFGSDPSSDYRPEDISYDGNAHASYTLRANCGGAWDGLRIKLGVPGSHNVYNSLAALAAASILGISPDKAASALEGFTGTVRRFEYKGTLNGVKIIDDYAHHPTEIAATLAAAANMPHEAIRCIFQSHTYTRTKALLDDFGRALSAADQVIVAEIYPARETDTLGMSAKVLADKINECGGNAIAPGSFEDIKKYVLENCRKGDVLITMGAGNVVDIADDLLSGR